MFFQMKQHNQALIFEIIQVKWEISSLTSHTHTHGHTIAHSQIHNTVRDTFRSLMFIVRNCLYGTKYLKMCKYNREPSLLSQCWRILGNPLPGEIEFSKKK